MWAILTWFGTSSVRMIVATTAVAIGQRDSPTSFSAAGCGAGGTGSYSGCSACRHPSRMP
jgi:hypothetical protein